ncbi:DoxX family membrane protein [Streptomyces sp. T1317-0309]|nr:DoxX family membrane protein [Streptomyces sp. T1317-0309]
MEKQGSDRLPAPTEPAARHSAGSGRLAGDCVLLLIRLTFGLLLAGHGAQKLFGLFGGQGLKGVGRDSRPSVITRERSMRRSPAFPSFLGGLGFALGLFTPLAAAALIGVMINAMVSVTAAHGLWDRDGGVEYNVGIAVVALAVAATGPGRLALDRFFRWGEGGWAAAAFALGIGGAASAVTLVL